jgi:hypothetical protein
MIILTISSMLSTTPTGETRGALFVFVEGRSSKATGGISGMVEGGKTPLI